MQLGSYRVLGEVGKGATATVYRALAPDGREVAVKFLARLTVEARVRFEREQQVLRELGEAEGFVPLLDAGSTSEGDYLVMAYVGGGTLSTWLRSSRPDVEEARALVQELAEALGRAHHRGLVHRDLKPDNVLRTIEGRWLVSDLGLAKHVEDAHRRSSASSLSLSKTGELRGTLGYAAPEQLADAKSAGPAADVFALGAILYECLAGVPAFVGATTIELLDSTARCRYRPLRALRPEVPRWLEDVVVSCLDPAPDRRPPDGAGLARALTPPPPRAGSRAALLAALGVAVVVVVIGALVATIARSDRTTAEPSQLLPPPAAPPTTLPPPPPAPPAARLRRRATWGESTGAHLGPVVAVAVAPDGLRALSVDSLGVGFVWSLPAGQEVTDLGLDAAPNVAAITTDGRALLGMEDGALRVHSLDDGRELSRATGPAAITGVAAVPGGRRVLVGRADGHLELWDLDEDARPRWRKAAHEGRVLVQAVQGQGDELAVSAGGDGHVRIWRLSDGLRRTVGKPAKPARGLAMTPRGGHALTLHEDGTFTIWYLADQRRGNTVVGKALDAVALHPERWELAASESGTILHSELQRMRPLGAMAGHRGAVTTLVFTPDGRHLLSGGADATLRLWSVDAHREVWSGPLHRGGVTAARWLDGARLVSTGRDGVLRVRRAAAADEEGGAPREEPVVAMGGRGGVGTGGDERRLATRGVGLGRVDDAELFSAEVHAGPVLELRAAAGGACLATRDAAGVTVWEQDASGVRAAQRLAVEQATRCFVFATGADRLLLGLEDGVGLVEGGGAPRLVTDAIRPVVELVALDDDVLALAADGRAALVARSTGELRRHLPALGFPPACAAGARDAAGAPRIVVGGARGELALLAPDGGALVPLPRAASPVLAVDLSPSARLVAVGTADGAIRLLDAAAGVVVERVELPGRRDAAAALAFSPDGAQLAVCTRRGVVVLYDVAR